MKEMRKQNKREKKKAGKIKFFHNIRLRKWIVKKQKQKKNPKKSKERKFPLAAAGKCFIN